VIKADVPEKHIDLTGKGPIVAINVVIWPTGLRPRKKNR